VALNKTLTIDYIDRFLR